MPCRGTARLALAGPCAGAAPLIAPQDAAAARYLQGHAVPIANGWPMNNVIYIVGLIVIVIAILSFFGLR
jgi:hypothetical protein